MKWYESDAGVQVVMFLGFAIFGWLVFMVGIIALFAYLIWSILG